METRVRTDRSAVTAALQTLIRPLKPRLAAPSKKYPAGSPQLKADKRAAKSIKLVERQQDGVYLYDVVPLRPKTDQTVKHDHKRHLYYVAGGGWQSPPSGQHWNFCAEVVNKMPDLAVTIISPPLAPASPYAETFPQLTKVFGALMQQSAANKEKVIIGGDSSGGNIVLALTLHAAINDSTCPLPDAVLVISPAVDLRHMEKDGRHEAVSRKDPVLTIKGHNKEAEQWANGEDLSQPWISPSLADLTVLAQRKVKIIGVTGGYDILTPLGLVFRDACKEAGVQGSWLHWEKQMHCFPLTCIYGIPEGKESAEWIFARLREV